MHLLKSFIFSSWNSEWCFSSLQCIFFVGQHFLVTDHLTSCFWCFLLFFFFLSSQHFKLLLSGPILKSCGMHVIFKKKGKKCLKNGKKAKYFKIWAKMYKIWKYFEKVQVIACNHHMQWTGRKGLVVHHCIKK